jgi:RNA polymerase sigma-70 factor, ECF subfamily
VVLRVLRSAEHAAEVTQEVFVEVWRQAGRYSPEKGSVMVDDHHGPPPCRGPGALGVQEAARDERYAAATADRPVDDVWAGVEQRLDAERVRKGMESLTAIQREAITLAYFGGYSQSQVSQLLNLPLGTVKTRIRDGLIGLRNSLGVELPSVRAAW